MPNLNTFSTLHERVKKCQTDYGLELYAHDKFFKEVQTDATIHDHIELVYK
jgi:hypothetical protein